MRHQRAGDLFLDALDRPPAGRLAFLAEACGLDRAMFDEVVSLLDAEAGPVTVLMTPAAEAFRAAAHRGPAVYGCPVCGLCQEFATRQDAARCPADGEPLAEVLDGSALIDGKYRIEKCLGHGGMGAVYRVRHAGLDKLFALKVMSGAGQTSPAWKVLFEREAKALGQLKHPNIVDVTDYGVDPRGLPYLVTELLEGETLEQFCRRGGSLEPVGIERAMPVLQSIAQAIDCVHSHGILHRDLKLGNVFLAGVPKLMDFGLAAVGEIAVEGIAGTPHYMPPELFSGQAPSKASDIYAFGVIVYAMLTGRFPCEPPAPGQSAPSPPQPSAVCCELPAEMDGAILEMLAGNPADRPPGAGEAMRRLRAAWLAARRKRWKAREIPRRLCAAALLGVLLTAAARYGNRLRPVERMELRAVDARFRATPAHPPDPRILLLLVDEPSLAADPKPLADRGDEFGASLDRIYQAGASAVAIDFLLPEPWSRSPAFSRLVMRHAESLTLGIYSSPAGATIGQECLDGLTAAGLGPRRVNSLLGFVNVDEDSAGMVHRGRSWYLDGTGAARPTWAASAASKLDSRATLRDRFWIDYAANLRQVPRVSWKDVGEALARNPGQFRGRLVLVGGDYLASGDTSYRSPADATELPGTLVEAAMVNTVLTGYPVRDAPAWIWFPAAAVFTALLLAAALVIQRGRVLALVAVPMLAGYMIQGGLLFRCCGLVIPLASPVVAMLCGIGASLILRRGLPRFPA